MKSLVAIIMAILMVGTVASCNDSATASATETIVINGIEMTVAENQPYEQYNCRRITAQRTTTTGTLWKGTRVVGTTSYSNCYCVEFPDGTIQGSQLVEHNQYADSTRATIIVVREYPLSTQDLSLDELATTTPTSTMVKLLLETPPGKTADKIQGVLHYGRKATKDNPIFF